MTDRETTERADAVAQPVFVDRSGRRRQMLIAIGASLTVAVVVALVTLVAGMFGVSPLRVPGFPPKVFAYQA